MSLCAVSKANIQGYKMQENSLGAKAEEASRLGFLLFFFLLLLLHNLLGPAVHNKHVSVIRMSTLF